MPSSNKSQKLLTWSQVWSNGEERPTLRQVLIIYCKGLLMGTADVIPGVSGGTVAFITGIYDKLLGSLSSLNRNFFGHLLRGKIKQAIVLLNPSFLIPLALGIITAIISTARIMHHLITEYRVLTWSLFFGLIAASIFIIMSEIEDLKKWTHLLAIALGTACAYIIVGLIPIHTPQTWWFIMFCGMLGVTAMILPGISGAFILLLLGKYEFITAAVKNPFNIEALEILCLFLVGVFTGLVSFSNLLHFCLKKYRMITISVLAGFMIGSMRKIWPWKQVLATKIIRGKVYVAEEVNILPKAMDQQLILSIALMITGLILVFYISSLTQEKKSVIN